MFEKLKLSQNELASELEYSILNNNLSQSSLFCGEQFTSKMTAALETAKALSCFEDNRPGCDCASCRQFKNLSVLNTVIVSNRNFETRIDAAIDRFVTLRTDFSKTYLIETVRILLLTYHSALYIDKNKNLFTAANEVGDFLLSFSTSNEEYSQKDAKKITKDLKALLKPLLDQNKKNLTNLSVDSVRSLQKWIGQTKVKEKARIIIIEAIEKSNDSVRNSLLKILEEPPEGVYFILLSDNPGRIMKTILSRVRRFYFKPLSKEIQSKILEPFFIKDESIDTIEKFFLSASGYKAKEIDDFLNRIVASLINTKRRGLELNEIWAFCEMFDKTEQSDFVLKSLIEKIERSFLADSFDATKASEMVRMINKETIESKIYNISKKNLMESIYRKLVEICNE